MRNAVNSGGVHRSIKKIVETFCSRICEISIDTGHPGDDFYVGYVPFERSPKAAISRGAAAEALVVIS